MAQPQIIGISKSQIYPVNGGSSAVYSFKNGNPQLSFEIAPTDRLLDTTTARLNFRFKILQSTGDRYPNNNNILTNGAANTIPSGAEVGTTNSRVGLNCLIQSLRIRNFSNQVIAEIRDFSRLMATTLPLTNSIDGYKTQLSSLYQAYGQNGAQESHSILPRDVSLPIDAGIFKNGQALDLMSIGGMKLDFNLAPSSFVVKGTAGVYYEISNVSMTYNSVDLSAPSPQSNDPILYPAYNSFSQILVASDTQKSTNFNLSSVRSVFQNFVPSSYINNYAQDSLETTKLKLGAGTDAEINSYSHLRNALKFPNKYSVEERDAVLDEAFPAHLYREFVDSVKSFKTIRNSMLSEITENINNAGTQANAGTEDLGKNVYGVGVRFDKTNSGIGSEFKNSVFTTRISSGLDGSGINSSYIFTLSNQQLNVSNQNIQPVS